MAETTLSRRPKSNPPGERDVRLLFVAHHTDAGRVGQVLPLAPGAWPIGREADTLSELWADDEWLSRRHAELTVTRQGSTLRDLRSRNGTFVNGRAIDEHALRDGDVIRVGDIVLVYRVAPVPEPVEVPSLVGCGPARAALLHAVDRAAPRSTPVLLAGGAGTGKGVVARLIHDRSGRSGPFVAFDCGAVSDGVVHSELFGHASGAFSGAERERLGLVEMARGGTLFLDEIGDASAALQSSLLRLLEEGEVRAVGSDHARKVDVRVVAATNRELGQDVTAGRFRFDLLTRLMRRVIDVPRLSARREDIGLIAHRRAQAHAGAPVRLATSFVEALVLRDYPGNVRELDALVERAIAEHEPGHPVRMPRVDGGAPPLPGSEPEPPPSSAGRAARPAREELAHLLRRHGGNVTHVATALGAARHSVYRWCREDGLDPNAFRGA